HEQDTAAKAVDGDLQSGWSISGRSGNAHNAVFQLAVPLETSKELTVDLTFERYYASALGRFRIWVTTADNAQATALPNPLQEALVKYRSGDALKPFLAWDQTVADRDALLRYFVTVAPELAHEHRQIAKLRSELPKLPTTLVMHERSTEHPRLTHLHHRGEFL